MLASWGSVLLVVTRLYYSAERVRCFDRLTDYVELIGQSIDRNFITDKQYLETAAKMLEQCDMEDCERIQEIMRTAEGVGMISRLEILLPGDILLKEGGREDVSGQLSFAEEAQQGVHIARQELVFQDKKRMILRNCIPLIQKGETVGILCGVVDLKWLLHTVAVRDYGDSMQIYIVDRKTEDFLLDTWHDSLGNMEGLKNRNPAAGYTREQFVEDFSERKNGTTVFQSQKAGENFYVSYAPVKEEDWMVIVSVPESIAFSYAENIQVFFHLLAGVLIITFGCYFFWTLRDMRREQRESEQGLKNIAYILDVEKNLFAAHMDPDQFYKALRKIAEYLSAERVFFWVRGSQKETLYWSCREDKKNEDVSYRKMFPGLFQLLKEKKGFVLHEIDGDPDISPEEMKWLRDKGVNSLMAIPVEKRNGGIIGVLGAVNMERYWETTEALEQVALSFTMTIEQYNSYRRLDQMGRIDAMTGLMNRNYYHSILKELAGEKQPSVSCVYIDANGLHDINNRLGHQAGDEMLIRIAEGLKNSFPIDRIFRIGGDEFVVLCENKSREKIRKQTETARSFIRALGYEISVGIQCQEGNLNISQLVNKAEAAMRIDKQRFYAENGKEKQSRLLDERAVKLMRQKQDMDMFLSVLSPMFKGVYFVDLRQDAVRHIFIPSYFSEILKQEGGSFKRGLRRYARQLVKAEFSSQFEQFCHLDHMEKRLAEESVPELTYQKQDGSWIHLYVMRTKHNEENCRETLWIFMDMSQSLDMGNLRGGGEIVWSLKRLFGKADSWEF